MLVGVLCPPPLRWGFGSITARKILKLCAKIMQFCAALCHWQRLTKFCGNVGSVGVGLKPLVEELESPTPAGYGAVYMSKPTAIQVPIQVRVKSKHSRRRY